MSGDTTLIKRCIDGGFTVCNRQASVIQSLMDGFSFSLKLTTYRFYLIFNWLYFLYI